MEPRKKVVAIIAVIGNIWNILVGKTKAKSGKAKAAGNFIFSNCNKMKTNGNEITAESSHEAINMWTRTPIVAAPTRAMKCLTAMLQ